METVVNWYDTIVSFAKCDDCMYVEDRNGKVYRFTIAEGMAGWDVVNIQVSNPAQLDLFTQLKEGRDGCEEEDHSLEEEVARAEWEADLRKG